MTFASREEQKTTGLNENIGNKQMHLILVAALEHRV